jgi:transposase-like protein
MTKAGTNRDTEALRAEIVQTRAELGETIQQLAERADVKSRVQQSVRRAGRGPLPWFVLAAGAAAAVALLIVAGRRR